MSRGKRVRRLPALPRLVWGVLTRLLRQARQLRRVDAARRVCDQRWLHGEGVSSCLRRVSGAVSGQDDGVRRMGRAGEVHRHGSTLRDARLSPFMRRVHGVVPGPPHRLLQLGARGGMRRERRFHARGVSTVVRRVRRILQRRERNAVWDMGHARVPRKPRCHDARVSRDMRRVRELVRRQG